MPCCVANYGSLQQSHCACRDEAAAAGAKLKPRHNYLTTSAICLTRAHMFRVCSSSTNHPYSRRHPPIVALSGSQRPPRSSA